MVMDMGMGMGMDMGVNMGMGVGMDVDMGVGMCIDMCMGKKKVYPEDHDAIECLLAFLDRG